MAQTLTADDILRRLIDAGLEPEVRRPPLGGVWILCDYAVVTQVAEDDDWHWATIQSAGSRSGHGSFRSVGGLRRLLDQLPHRGAEPKRPFVPD